MRARPPRQLHVQGHRHCSRSWLALTCAAAAVGLVAMQLMPMRSVAAECDWNGGSFYSNSPVDTVDGLCPKGTLTCKGVSSGVSQTCCFRQPRVSIGGFWANSWHCCQVPDEGFHFACPSGTTCSAISLCGEYACCSPGTVPMGGHYEDETGAPICHAGCCPADKVICPQEAGACCSNLRFCTRWGYCVG